MSARLNSCLLLWAVLATVMPSVAQADPTALLARMNAAFAEQDYDGVFTYFAGGDVATLRLVHKVIDGQHHERLIHLNGAPREMIRKGDDVVCIVHPEDTLVALEDSIPSGPFARSFAPAFESIGEHYMVEAYGHGRVADRVALRLAVAPKDNHRYGYRLWVDADTALLLRSELVDHEGRKLEIFQFANVRIGDGVDAASLEPSQAENSMVSHLRLESQNKVNLSAASEPDMPRWQATWVPAGFDMSGEAAAPAGAAERPMNTLMYSDGLANFSIFIEPMPRQGAADMTSQNGATLALTHAIQHGQSHYLVTLVGEIPLDTARRVVRSLKPRPA